MTQYGYRLWAVDLHLGRQHQRQEFGSALIPIEELDENGRKRSAGSRSIDYIKNAAVDVDGDVPKTHSFGLAKGVDVDDGTDPKGFSMRFERAEVLGSNLRLNFHHGLRHRGGVLIDPDDPSADDTPLKNKSTLHSYRALLVTQPSLKRGLLAVEARGRSCPMVSVVRGLNEINSEHLRLRVISHLADEAAFLDFIRNSQVKQVLFDRWAYDDDGAKDRREVSMGVMTAIETKTVVEAAIHWCKDYFGFQKIAKTEKDVELANELDTSKLSTDERKALRAQAKADAKAVADKAKAERHQTRRATAEHEASQLKHAIFASRDEDVSIDFTDVSVDLLNNGSPKRIGPLTDFRRLTYGISTDVLPSDDRFYAAAEETATRLLHEVQGLPLS